MRKRGLKEDDHVESDVGDNLLKNKYKQCNFCS